MIGPAGSQQSLHASLLRLTRQPRPWNEAEAALTRGGWTGAQLGGDPIRPYLVHAVPDHVTVTAVQRPHLPDPPMVAELLQARYGPPAVRHCEIEHGGPLYPDAKILKLKASASPALAARLAMPRVLLVGLGDRDRYRGARLPLGVARLASWLRFTHAAKVDVIDYSLQDDPLGRVADALAQRPDVVGVGVNFGQWRLLYDFAELLEHQTTAWEKPPVVVLGNILAAFSPEEATKPFKQAAGEGRVLIATGLGEQPLESVCRTLHAPQQWRSIPGLRQPISAPAAIAPERRAGPQPVRADVPTSTAPSRPPSPWLVAPDDSLVLAVMAQGGQLALETSLGCQFGACTFCPRAHKGAGWRRTDAGVCVAVLERFSHLRTPGGNAVAVSLVDEEFFGAEGLADPPPGRSKAARILTALEELGITYEVYTRLEQLFDRRRSPRWNLQRARLLAQAAPHMRRLFVGVESGSASQLRRYGKGQTLTQTVDALRIASVLGVPLEFGFITFDPLLSPDELAENLAFLARTDVLCERHPDGPTAAVAAVGHYLNGADQPTSADPVYQHVAYMATELEVLANSRYADHLHRRHPDLLDEYNPAFCRFEARYAHKQIEQIAGWCRVWTEGMFTTVYQARMAARSAGPGGATDATELVRRYRDATFTLLVTLTDRFLPGLRLPRQFVTPTAPADVMALLVAESVKVTGRPLTFDTGLLERHRDR
ncbi:B12-binding domain-containing radical SAM protein [Actinomadura sp. 9N407]|uniref:B12-binding domain-containing radical SAM protein n=1 Tax=Actinomadura sp. 9N407 TaxID=3375154 RepID=UPI0037BBE090